MRSLNIGLSGCTSIAEINELGLAVAGLSSLRNCNVDLSGCVALKSVATLGASVKKLRQLQYFNVSLSNCKHVVPPLSPNYYDPVKFGNAVRGTDAPCGKCNVC